MLWKTEALYALQSMAPEDMAKDNIDGHNRLVRYVVEKPVSLPYYWSGVVRRE